MAIGARWNRYVWGVVCLVAAFAFGAKAATQTVQHSSGSVLYAIVTPDADVPVSKQPKPGIYLWERNALGRMIVPGAVLEPREGGFHRFLEMSGRTRRFEAVAVVDGKVRIFSTKSLGSRRGSILTLGEGDAAVVAANDHAPVIVPPVLTEKDITVWGKLNGMVEILLVSIRTPGNPLGDGMTLALVLSVRNATVSDIPVLFPPVLLDWKFHPERELVDFYFDGGVGADPRHPGLRCPVVERALSVPRDDDPEPLVEWREQLAAEMANKRRKSKKRDDADLLRTFPFLRLEDGEVEIRELPSVRDEDEQFASVFDPISSRHGVVYGAVPALSALRPANFKLHGALESDAEGTILDWAREEGFSIYRRTDGRFAALLEAAKQTFVDYPAPPGQSGIVEATFYYALPAEGKKPGVLVSSWKRERSTENATFVQEVRIEGAVPRFGAFVPLAKDFWTDEQLERRILNGDSDARGTPTHRVILKKELPAKRRADAIQRLVGPWVELEATLRKGELSYVFPVAERETSLGNHAYYRVFPQIRGVDSANGFFVGPLSRESDRLLDAEAVAPKSKSPEDFLPLAKAKMKRRGSDSEVTLQAFLVDASHAKGREAQIAIRVVDEETNGQRMGVMGPVFDANSFVSFKFLPQAKRWSWEKEPELLGFGVLVLKGKTVIYPVAVGKALEVISGKAIVAKAGAKGKDEDDDEEEEEEEEEAADEPAVVDESVGIHSAKNNKRWVEAFKPWLLEKKGLTDSEIRNRLRFVDGVPYFIANPELELEDYDFAVLNGKDGAKLFLNRDLETKVRFDPEGEATLPSGWGKANTWAVTVGSRREKEFQVRMRRIRGAVEYKRDVLPELRELLESFASRESPARHVVYVVPNELKSYLVDYPLALYFRDDEEDPRYWTETNHKLLLSLIGTADGDQATILDNLRTMRELAQSRSRVPVLVGSLSDVQTLNRPSAGDRRDFRLKDVTLEKRNVLAVGPEEPEEEKKPEDGAKDEKTKKKDEADPEEMRKTVAPHLLYLLANDGERTSLQKFQPTRKAQVPMLLIGTEEEWARLKSDAQLENRWKLFEHFEEVKLTTSTAETRRRVIRELLASPELQTLGYSLDVSEIVPRHSGPMSVEEAADIMARFVDQQTASLARQYNIHPFVALLRVLNALSEELTYSEELRGSGRIGRAAIGRVLTKVFPMPLSAQFLPEKDPLRIVMDPDFLLWWDDNGYKGDHRVKKEVQDALLAQLNSSSVKTIPASMLVYGSTGTGKTSLVKSLFRTLKLVPYNFDAANDQENRHAQSFFLDMNRFSQTHTESRHEDSFNGELLTVDAAISHLHKFLSGPNGSQGFVCLDDFHSAPPEVRERFLKLIRNLANEQYYRVGSRNIPTRNIRLFITLNPTDDQARIKKYTKDPRRGPTDEEVILATLNQEGQNTFDKSHLARFGLKLNIGSFTTSAKGPALTDQIRKELRNQFGTDGTFTVVTEEAVKVVSEHFPDTDARSFLSAAARAITTVDVANADNAVSFDRLFVVVPRSANEVVGPIRPLPGAHDTEDADHKGAGAEEARIHEHVSRVLKRLPVKAGYEGKINFLIYLLNNFRKRLVETAFRAITNDPESVRSADAVSLWMAPLARGFHDHILSVPEFPLDRLELQPEKLLSHPGEALAFRNTLAQIRLRQARRLVQLPRVGDLPPGFELSGAWGETATSGATRQSVLKETVQRLHDLSETALVKWLQFDPRNPPTFEDWIRSLPENDVVLKELSAQVVQQFARYSREMTSTEVLANASGRHPSPYETARLFAMALDRAIGQLPWGRVTGFLIDALDRMTGDLTLGGERGVERLLFEGKTSPLLNMDTTYLLQVLRNYSQFGEQKTLEGNTAHDEFVRSCAKILEIAGRNGGST